MALGTYKVHDEIQNEEKWLKLFSLPQLTAVAVAAVIGIGFIAFFSSIELLPVGVFFFIAIVLMVGMGVMIPMPKDWYLFGGGELIGVLALRILIKLLFKKVLYISNLR